MKLKKIISIAGLVLFLAGCASVSQPRAVISDGVIQNSSLGFFGFTFEIPEGFEIYSPATKNLSTCNGLQQMAIRIYNANRTYHPRGNELFYESFLLLSDNTCFLLITLKADAEQKLYNAPFANDEVSSWELMPLYNVTVSRSFEMGESRQPAVYTRGSAYEKKGWYYSGSRRGGMPFNYEACKVTGGNRDRYILMGFALPDHAGDLTDPMREMVEGMKFRSR